MTKFAENISKYLAHNGIKQSYVSLMSGIDSKKISRILTGVQDVNFSDMEKISAALGKPVEFFISDDLCLEEKTDFGYGADFVFYAGEPTGAQEDFAKTIIELIENADEVLGAKERYTFYVRRMKGE